MPNLDLTITDIMHGDTPVLKIMKGDIRKWPYVVSTYTISGIVTDGSNPLSGVLVALGNNSMTTDSDGVYSFVGVESDTYTLSAAKSGYSFESISIAVVGDATHNIEMLPYDAEVEWLQSDGTSYINAGIVPEYSTEIKVKATIISWLTSGVLAGVRNNGTNSNGRYLPLSQSSTNSRTCLGTDVVTINSSTLPMYTLFELLFNENSTHKVYLNESLVTTFTGGVVVNNSNTLYIFAANGYSPETYPCIAKIYYLQIKQNNNLIRDYIPVRRNGVGYLYDKISKQLFGNAGTGTFVFKSDSIDPDAPYDSEVEYLQCTGTQWISLGSNITLSTNVKVEYKARRLPSSGNQRLLTYGNVSAKSNFSVWELTNGYAASMLGVEKTISSNTSTSDHVIVQERLSASSGTFTINGGNPTSVSGTFVSGTHAITLMASGTGADVYTGRLYYLKIWQDGNLMFDLIPVRKNGIGYLYDNVSNTLFGNSGTGEFTYGNDIT